MEHSIQFLKDKIERLEEEASKLTHSNKYNESYIYSRINQINAEIEDMEEELNSKQFGDVF